MGRDQIPDFDWERLALGELPEQRLKEIQTHPKFDIQHSTVMTRIRNSNSEILEQYPPEVMTARIRERTQVIESRDAVSKGARARSPFLALLTRNPRLTATLAAVLLVTIGTVPLIRQGSPETPAQNLELTRIKGLRPDLRIYREKSGIPELLRENALVQENDLLQIGYVSGGWTYGAIFSIDGNGAVTLHFPADIFSSMRLDSDGEIKLPYSYRLDSAPEFERFFFVLSDKEFSLNEILLYAEELAESRNIRSIRSLTLPEGYEQASIVLKKGAPE